MRPTFCVLAVATLTLALGACGGDSSGDKASTPTPEEMVQTTVCHARADISMQVDELKGLTAATVTKDGVTQSVDAIKKSPRSSRRSSNSRRPTRRRSRR
jgi:hypothetical protein